MAETEEASKDSRSPGGSCAGAWGAMGLGGERGDNFSCVVRSDGNFVCVGGCWLLWDSKLKLSSWLRLGEEDEVLARLGVGIHVGGFVVREQVDRLERRLK